MNRSNGATLTGTMTERRLTTAGAVTTGATASRFATGTLTRTTGYAGHARA
jgi:hypothetical protein